MAIRSENWCKIIREMLKKGGIYAYKIFEVDVKGEAINMLHRGKNPLEKKNKEGGNL